MQLQLYNTFGKALILIVNYITVLISHTAKNMLEDCSVENVFPTIILSTFTFESW